MKSLVTLLLAAGIACAAPIDSCRITWTTPSSDSVDSMPLSGRLGAGANVWVQDGSIWLYLAHSGAYDSHGRLLKLGCVRLTPNDLDLGGAGFLQTLDPATGTIAITQDDFKATLWFAGETLVFESETGTARPLGVAFGSWRDQTRDGIRNDMMGSKTTFFGDQIQASSRGFLVFHRNADNAIDLADKARGQGITPESLPEMTARRVSGSAIAIEGGFTGQPAEASVRWQFWDGKAWSGITPARKQQVVTMRLAAAVGADPEAWSSEARAMLSAEQRRITKADELKRWKEFWSRSHVVINPDKGEPDPGFLIGRNYQLFRYMLACNRDGELPLLFNGGIFTTDNNGRIKGNNNDELPTFEGEPVTPDFRRWMGCYFMSQNQRWLGWPAVAGGDGDLLAPTTRFYRDRAAVAAARAKRQGADGVVYTEPLDVWGLCPVAPRPDGLCGAQHLTYHFSMGLENAWMNLLAHFNTGYPIAKDLEWMIGTVYFYDAFYRAETRKRTGKALGDDGKLVIYPGNGLEYAGDATNPVDGVSGLLALTEGLLRYPELPAADRQRLERTRETLPPLPTGNRQGRLAVLPAKTYTVPYNRWEPIEMYACWPYRLLGITQPDTLPLARDTWETVPEDRARLCKQDYSWMANVVNMAALAWPEQAQQRAIYKMANISAPQARFPAFFGPGHDWLPDHNWGGAGMTGIQEMLLAPEPRPDGKLHLFPGWPAEWDVDFKLHAPGRTIVEASLKSGRLVSLKVTPAAREKDIVNWLGTRLDRERLEEVPLSRIRLLESPFKQRQDVHGRVLLGYEVDRLLHNFRVNAGLPSPATPYGGWEAPGCGLRGHFTGHYLSACAMMFAATGDPVFKARVDRLVDGLADCQQALGNGYLSAFPVSEFEKLETRFFDGVWAPYYTIHKIMAGLLNAHEHTGNQRAREIAVAMADYFAARLARLAPEALEKMTLTNYKGNPVNEYGGIAESFLAVHRLTQDPRHLAAARAFIRDWFLDPLARGDDQLAGLHANTHIPQARSFVAAAEVVDDPRLLPAARYFFDQVTHRRSFAFGGNAFDEKFGAPGVESRSYDDLTGETCNTHNLLQFSRALFARTGEAQYADFHEHALLNHILASIAPAGQTTYHVAAQPGRFKVYGGRDNCFWCCTGTGIENTARYAQGIYFTSGNSLWISQYIPSRVELPGDGFTLVQESDFPAGETIRFMLEAKKPFDAALRFRLPSWLAGPAEARLNGALTAAPAATRDGAWLVLERTWQPGDRIELRLPMNVRVRPAMDDPALVSFFHGPVLLAGALGREAMPEFDVVTSQTAYHQLPPVEVPALKRVSPDALQPASNRPLTYTAPTADDRQVTLVPFYNLHHQRYSLYWRAAR
jgi:uncharacterized protein